MVVAVGMYQVAKLLLEFFFAEQDNINYEVCTVVVVVFGDNTGACRSAVALESQVSQAALPWASTGIVAEI